jgi:hypothetical protein
MRKFVSAVCAAALALSATPAFAALLNFNFVATNPAQSISFQLDSNPTPDFIETSGAYIIFDNVVTTSILGTNAPGRIAFFPGTGASGGFQAFGGPNRNQPVVNASGAPYTQLYTGTQANPVFAPLTYTVFPSFSTEGTPQGVLTITGPNANPGAVPEPSTWLTMLGGFGVMGAAMRRKQKLALTYRAA